MDLFLWLPLFGAALDEMAEMAKAEGREITNRNIGIEISSATESEPESEPEVAIELAMERSGTEGMDIKIKLSIKSEEAETKLYEPIVQTLIMDHTALTLDLQDKFSTYGIEEAPDRHRSRTRQADMHMFKVLLGRAKVPEKFPKDPDWTAGEITREFVRPLANRIWQCAAEDRRPMLTSKGDCGLVPETAQEGDELVVLYGCCIPLVVRKHSDGSHRLVGGCFVQGAMYGDILDAMHEGTVSRTQLFHFR